VVDDDPSIRLLCRVNLELDGIDVLEAGSLRQAREQLAATEVDVVLLDVHVGTESGLDLLHELRQDRPDVRIALLTGSEGEAERKVEPDAIVGKPFTLDELRITVERLAEEAVGSAGDGDDRRAHTG
jgi:two-component system, NtrC family, response regulator PilR